MLKSPVSESTNKYTFWSTVCVWCTSSPLPLHWQPGSSFLQHPPVWQSCRAEEDRRDLETQNNHSSGSRFQEIIKDIFKTQGAVHLNDQEQQLVDVCSFYLLTSPRASTWCTQLYIQSDHSPHKTVEQRTFIFSDSHGVKTIPVIDKFKCGCGSPDSPVQLVGTSGWSETPELLLWSWVGHGRPDSPAECETNRKTHNVILKHWILFLINHKTLIIMIKITVRNLAHVIGVYLTYNNSNSPAPLTYDDDRI